MTLKMKFALMLVLGLLASPAGWAARDHIDIVGSSTVYPFATVVAEQFGQSTEFKTPKVESTGSGGGLKLFCAGVGIKHPDIANSSRRIKSSELERCRENGVTEIIEVKIGYDGIVLANAISAPAIPLSLKDLYLALAQQIPDPASPESGKLIKNPHHRWNEVNKNLPEIAIEVLGPPPTSGTRDAFVELAMEGGCKEFAWIEALKKHDKQAYKSLCHTMRADGAFIEVGENDNLIVQKLVANPAALGVFGFSFLDQNGDKVQGSAINGVKPEFETIASGDYSISRPLYFYVKKAHVDSIPGIQAFLTEFTSERAWGDEGYLTDKGLIPMPEGERKQFAKDVKSLKVIDPQ